MKPNETPQPLGFAGKERQTKSREAIFRGCGPKGETYGEIPPDGFRRLLFFTTSKDPVYVLICPKNPGVPLQSYSGDGMFRPSILLDRGNVSEFELNSLTHSIHVLYIYLHLVAFNGKIW